MDVGKSGRVQVEDIMYLVRKDKRKYARVKELLNMNEELKKARKAFDEVKYTGNYSLIHGTVFFNLVSQ
jgi:transcription initiation factor TFIID subunit 13